MSHDPRTPEQTETAGRTEPAERLPSLESVREVLDATLNINAGVHHLIFDYSLAAAIVAAPPSIPWVYELKLVAIVILNVILVRSIGARWGFPRGQGPLAIAMGLLGILEALILMVAAYMVVYSVSLYVWPIRSWAEAAAYFTLTLAMGRVANEYYLSARRINPRRIHLVLRRHRRRKAKARHKERDDVVHPPSN